jgi:hypothetical protein
MVTLQIPLIDSIAKEEVKKTMIKQWMDEWMDGWMDTTCGSQVTKGKLA